MVGKDDLQKLLERIGERFKLSGIIPSMQEVLWATHVGMPRQKFRSGFFEEVVQSH